MKMIQMIPLPFAEIFIVSVTCFPTALEKA